MVPVFNLVTRQKRMYRNIIMVQQDCSLICGKELCLVLLNNENVSQAGNLIQANQKVWFLKDISRRGLTNSVRNKISVLLLIDIFLHDLHQHLGKG